MKSTVVNAGFSASGGVFMSDVSYAENLAGIEKVSRWRVGEIAQGLTSCLCTECGFR